MHAEEHSEGVTAKAAAILHRRIYGITIKDHLIFVLAIAVTALLNILVRPKLMDISFEYQLGLQENGRSQEWTAFFE